jgi:hypothetical protein
MALRPRLSPGVPYRMNDSCDTVGLEIQAVKLRSSMRVQASEEGRRSRYRQRRTPDQVQADPHRPQQAEPELA